MSEVTLDRPAAPARRVIDRWNVLLAAAVIIFMALNAVAILRLLHEHSGTNSYVLEAAGWLHGHLGMSACWDTDCVHVNGLIYNVFPPFPALILLPFVAIFGSAFAGTLALAYALYLLTAWLWWRIARAIGRTQVEATWLMLAAVAGSPLYIVFLGADTVWFFAQICAFFLVTLALSEVVCGQRLITAGIALGAAFLCRQMSIFYLPFLFVLSTPKDSAWWQINSGAMKRALAIGLPVIAALLAYFAFNIARFGHPLDTGYGFIKFSDPTLGPRLRDFGLFNKAYFLFNLLYLTYQGPHVVFGGPDTTQIVGMDKWGAALLAASPWLFCLFFVRYGREMIVGALIVAFIAGSMLLYHSNGYVQYGVQRYTLDFLPIALYALASGLPPADFKPFRVLTAWSLVLTATTAVVLAFIKTAVH